MIYLASPYTHDSHAVRVERFHAACKAAAWLMARGHHVYSPIAHTHPIAEVGELPKDFAYWESYDRWFLDRCYDFVVLTIDGWQESKGVQREIELARELGKPMGYMKMCVTTDESTACDGPTTFSVSRFRSV